VKMNVLFFMGSHVFIKQLEHCYFFFSASPDSVEISCFKIPQSKIFGLRFYPILINVIKFHLLNKFRLLQLDV